MELFGNVVQFVYRQENEAQMDKNNLPTVKHDGGSIVLSGFSAASGTGGTECSKGTMKAEDYWGILERNELLSVRKLGSVENDKMDYFKLT